MLMVYLLFVMALFFIRILAGYDSRYQTGKSLTLKSPVFAALLLDRMSFYERSPRPKKDRNKMSVCGIVFYAAALAVLLVNLVFRILPAIPSPPLTIEASEFFVSVDTLNDKISAIGVFLLALSVLGYLAVAILRAAKEIKPKWVRLLVWVVAGVMLLTVVLSSVALLVEVAASFS